ncbi:Lipoprotein NlpD [Thioalkalivibrio nitratireducens DSM 14787]|uniref:Lipoprotein NlpD n=1 Tax=Thioalkalivibrio nitratireducens (strain DSM 14787 / UNIQEM 213 / ALEN2) TaxID=1255043 RepID=L0DZW4_THIND|nr:peptidoglycan DD-metalloendopeptidase family protein [Thioalkalivibrio nitratireducens]AGA34593.1 Lipoprotein NlpD [Thioalkalivibrio nitratireducens DSM 14787]
MRTGSVTRGIVIGVLAAWLAGCAARAPEPRTPAADTHVVQRGETLYRISTRNGLDWRDVARRNGIGPPYLIYPGQRLRLAGAAPLASRPEPARAASPPPPASRDSEPSAAPASRTPDPPPTPEPSQRRAATPAAPESPPRSATPAAVTSPQWQWPADGPVLRAFSNSSASRRGIAIGGERGDEIRAANGGEVVYAGSGLVGYGRLIIIKHDARFISAYGHNEELLVREGDRVQRGDRIARLGDSGAERPMLHFEIRVDGTPVDPIRFLPRR